MSEAKGNGAMWPITSPLWSLGALGVAVLFFVVACWERYAFLWTPLERYYLVARVKSWYLEGPFGTNAGSYNLLYVVDQRGQSRLALPDEIATIKRPDGKTAYQLTDVGLSHGWVKPVFRITDCNEERLHNWLEGAVYRNHPLSSQFEWAGGISLGVFLLLLVFAGRKDRQRALALLRGKRLSGSELVSTSGFNRKMWKRKKLQGDLVDGIMFPDAGQNWLRKNLDAYASCGVRIPREREQMHWLMLGDSGYGKTTAIRHVLSQVQGRKEAAIVYDPSGDLVAQFYRPERGDILLNPLDARCPFYALGDEIENEAEALTLAKSLFPDREHENHFFVDAPRRIIAHLLQLNPTPEELVFWLSHRAEIDRRVRGTELEAMIDVQAPAQRMGVLASLNMVASALKLLPREEVSPVRFSTKAWAKKRKGWIFLTSTPETRESLRPLISLWVDLLVLRIMSTKAGRDRKTWFVVDELASLQRLPQLPTAMTEIRKANCCMVLGLQGKAQLDALYGCVSESMISQTATKLFFKTSEPDAAEWVSRSIGKVEYLRYQESRTDGAQHESAGTQRTIVPEPLVLDSDITGLEPLECYIRHGRYAVQMDMRYLDLPQREEPFQPRELSAHVADQNNNGDISAESTQSSPVQQFGSTATAHQTMSFFE
jgi:type IV secretory pathway TraG/TraD family ATPase VirD4